MSERPRLRLLTDSVANVGGQNSLELKKQEYLKHARQVSYAMQGKSTAEIGDNKVNEFLEWLEIKDPSKIVRERRSM